MSLAIERPKKAAPAPKNDGVDHLTVLPTELIIVRSLLTSLYI